MKKMIAVLAAALALVACKNSGKVLLPNVSGKAGEVIVVLDKTDWEGALGNEVRDLLADECPWLTPREPMYSLVNVVPSNFVDLFKVHRNIVFFEMNPQAEEGVILRNDVWASPQVVLQVNAHDAESAVSVLKENKEMILNSIEQAERNRVITNTLLYEERNIAPQVREIMGGSPHFPSGYKLKKKTSDFVWIADEKQYTMQGVLIYKYPAAGDASDFTAENIIAHRNEALRNNVPGMFENTYMTTSDYITPTLTFMRYKGRDFVQTRGYWEVYNDYMGGPFVSHAFYTPDSKEILVLDAFVYAPKYDKREYLRQLEAIIYSWH